MKISTAKSILVIVGLICALLHSTIALAGFWSDFARDITKAVIVGVIVKTVTTPKESYATERPSQQVTEKQENTNAAIQNVSAIKNIVVGHFYAQSQCDLEQLMSFYGSTINFKDIEYNKDELQVYFEEQCDKRKITPFFKIKNNSIKISESSTDDNIVYVEYDVTYNVYRKNIQQRVEGLSNVKLVISNQEIIGEYQTNYDN